MAQFIIQLSGSASGIEDLQLPIDDPVRRRPDTSGAHDFHGRAATTRLEEGLVSTIRYFQSLLSDDAHQAPE